MGSSFSGRCTSPAPGAGRALAASVLAVALLTLLAFWPVQRNGFVLFDDEDYISRNAVVKGGLTAGGVALAFTRSYAANWLPLTWVSHMLDVELFGLDPRGHHLVSLAIHLATAVLLLLALRAMTGSAGTSFLVAALFAVHPLHVESVAWAAERKDVLSACFWMLTTAAYLRYARRPVAVRYLPVPVFFALGLMAKQMLVTLPLVLLLLDWWPLGRGRRPFALVLEKVPLFALAALAGLFTLKAQAAAGLVHSLNTFPLAARLANALLAPLRYLGKTVWPSDLSVFYPYVARKVDDPLVIAAGATLVAVSAGAFLLRRRFPWLLTGWLWYLATLLPVLGLIQVGDQAGADRYTYLPLVGVFVACSWSLKGACTLRALPGRALAAAIAVLLLLQAGLTRRQVEVWRDTGTLFRHAARVTKDNWLAAYFIGLSLDQAGDADGALRSYRESIRIKPDFEQSRQRLARLLHKQGRTPEAVSGLHAAVAAIPVSRALRISLAFALREQGSLAEAVAELRAAVAAIPDDPELRMALSLALADQGMEEEAVFHLRELIRLWPGVPDPYNNLAALLARRGRLDEAVTLLRQALEIDPDYADARRNLEALTGAAPLRGRPR